MKHSVPVMNSEYPGINNSLRKPGKDHKKEHDRNTPKGARALEEIVLHFILQSWA